MLVAQGCLRRTRQWTAQHVELAHSLLILYTLMQASVFSHICSASIPPVQEISHMYCTVLTQAFFQDSDGIVILEPVLDAQPYSLLALIVP